MSAPDPGRPVPDADDLRILSELVRRDWIPLAEAAWNARMPVREAAERLVLMAERGMPLRLIAEGDRQALWRITQAGPATSGLPAAGAVGGPGPRSSVPTPLGLPGHPLPPPGHPSAPGPAAVGRPGTVPPPVPPVPAVPPHEQAIAGAVPLGQPPFGTPAVAGTDESAERPAGVPTPPAGQPAAGPLPVVPTGADAPPPGPVDPSRVWGIPGSAAWARTDPAERRQES
ncbi:hypothetical protein GCM10011594_35360 [Nakamurella endophytica]|uniref:Uncharacterized protein n=2 Tax=Nakamurella endophytica TaxID=1748367 RepID=A0A917T800_9ACTN|nr:hypothetical protein GCM10011594_35360 [Nakamurella endophytica]